jgi:hypothetical protein
LLRILKKQAKGVAVACDGMGARLPLSDQSIDEERF